jgi:hypothetical protein
VSIPTQHVFLLLCRAPHTAPLPPPALFPVPCHGLLLIVDVNSFIHLSFIYSFSTNNSYAEAHKIKLKADALEAWELEKWHSQRQQELLQKEAKFKHVKQQELVALQKRIQTGREEQKKQRHQDLERLLQRYQNVKAELEAQQNLERVRMEKLVQSGALTSTSSGGRAKKRGGGSARHSSNNNNNNTLEEGM